MSTIVLNSAYAGAGAAPQPDHHRHDGHATQVSPDQLGGTYEFLDLQNRRVTASDFQGHWSLLFFGYARCKASCPVATPKIVKAAQMLRARGIKARAVFVDIDAPPLGLVLRTPRPAVTGSGHNHSGMNRLAAMRALQSTWGGNLSVLTGSRMQLANAARAFMVSREHTPPRNGEKGHSINHSSRIYLIAPDTKVAGYGNHDSDPTELAETVVRLSAHKRAAHPDDLRAGTAEDEARQRRDSGHR